MVDMMTIGLQLYSVREEIEKYGLDTVLKGISDAGCRAVEFAGFYGLTPKEMKEKLEKYSLIPHSAHIGVNDIEKNLPYIDELGIREVYIPWYDCELLRTEEGFAEFINKVNKIKPELDRRGVLLGYHNHSAEFAEGRDLLDELSSSIPDFKLELDIFWSHAAGKDSLALIKKYGKRLHALHLKDMNKLCDIKEPCALPHAIVGEGQCDAEACTRLAAAQGVRTFIIEVEGFPCDYKEYLEKSIKNINEYLEETMKTVNLGVIGCGGIANGKHLPSYSKLKNVRLVAFCDIIEERAVKAKADYGTEASKVYVDYKELLKDESIDAVLVLTHNALHCEITVAALDAGKHVLCEKPMAMNYEEAKAMIAARDRAGKVLTVGYQNRFRANSMYLKELADADEFGNIYYAEATALRRRAVPTWGVFIDEEKQGGGPLIDIGTHALDLTLYTMNNYEPAYCVGKTFHMLNKDTQTGNSWGDWDTEKFTAEDSAFGFIVMKNGAVINLRSSWALNYVDAKEAITLICGNKGGADMPNSSELRINGIKNGKQYVLTPNLASGGVAFYDGDADDVPEVREARCFINTILGNGELVVTAEQAACVTRILEGIYESEKSGKPYYFD